MENFKTGVANKRLTYKKHANSNLNVERNNFLASKIVGLVLGLCVKYYSNNFAPETNCKTVYCSLKNMTHRIGAHGDTKCQNLDSFFEKRWIYRKRKAFFKPIWHQSFCFFSELKGYLAKLFLKRLSVSLVFTFII